MLILISAVFTKINLQHFITKRLKVNFSIITIYYLRIWQQFEWCILTACTGRHENDFVSKSYWMIIVFDFYISVELKTFNCKKSQLVVVWVLVLYEITWKSRFTVQSLSNWKNLFRYLVIRLQIQTFFRKFDVQQQQNFPHLLDLHRKKKNLASCPQFQCYNSLCDIHRRKKADWLQRSKRRLLREWNVQG